MNITKDSELSKHIVKKLKAFSYDLTQDKSYTCAEILLDKLLEIVPYSYEMEVRLKPLLRIKKCKASIGEIYNSHKITKGIQEVIGILLDEEKDSAQTRLLLEEKEKSFLIVILGIILSLSIN